jgi:hypothetical protein
VNSTLRDLFAAMATDEDVKSIQRENIGNFTLGKKVYDRVSARWEFADRMLASREAKKKEKKS